MFTGENLHFLRADELDVLASYLPPRSKVLELGAGTGYQALGLKERGFEVEAIDLPDSSYSLSRVHPVTDFDGLHIPFPDASFDVVMSSNVLEHVRDLPGLLAETKRVLKPGGSAVHAMPSPTWRLWTSLAGPLDALPFLVAAATGQWEPPKRAVPRPRLLEFAKGCVARFVPLPHGEGGNAVTELRRFSKQSWLQVFEENDFDVVSTDPMNLFYTGWSVLGHHWSIDWRRRAAGLLGSACLVYVVRPRAKHD